MFTRQKGVGWIKSLINDCRYHQEQKREGASAFGACPCSHNVDTRAAFDQRFNALTDDPESNDTGSGAAEQGGDTLKGGAGGDGIKSSDDQMLEPGERHVTPEEFEHNATRWHYEDRDALNQPLPDNAKDARRMGFEKYPEWQNAAHQNEKGKPEVKFVHPDGREVIFDGDTGEVITDPELRGTYNYVNTAPDEDAPRYWWEYLDKLRSEGAAGHILLDYFPYSQLGNDRDKK